MQLASTVFVGLVAAAHLYFLVLESFLWATPFGIKTFKMTPAKLSSAMDDLYAALGKIVKDKKAEKGLVPKLEIQFADDVRYQFVIKMIDDAKLAGFEKISPNLLGKDRKKPPQP